MKETLASTVLSDGITQQWLEEVCRRTDEILWDSYRFALGVPDAPWPRVMFPRKGHERRVSEQEARFAFVAALLGDDASDSWSFAAEVPTRLSYRFAHRGTGLKAQRALTDLALYGRGDDDPALAVEFKSGGRSGKSEQDQSIKKDIAKVLAEQPDALWFHVVRSVNNATLQGLLRTLDAAIALLSDPVKLGEYLAPGKTVEPRAKTIAFHICVLNPDMTASIHRVLDFVPGKPRDDFFMIETTASRTSLEIADGQGWRVHRRSQPMVS
jgi:hypothetical protein